MPTKEPTKLAEIFLLFILEARTILLYLEVVWSFLDLFEHTLLSKFVILIKSIKIYKFYRSICLIDVPFFSSNNSSGHYI